MRGEAGVTTVKRRAITILSAFDEADARLFGKAVVLTDGKRRGRWRPSGLTTSTASESLSKATLESGLSQPSNSRKARCRPSARPHAIQEEFDGSLSSSFLDLWTGCDAVVFVGIP